MGIHDEGTTATLPAPVAAPARTGRGRAWNVLLHNDDTNTFAFVIRSLCEIVRLEAMVALERATEAHKTGAAIVAETHREHAELLEDRLRSRGLVATIEPAV